MCYHYCIITKVYILLLTYYIYQVKTANRQNTYRDQYCSEIQTEFKSFKYGRAINFSYGLIAGLILDKSLFVVSKGLSVFFPPFAVLLMGKGKVLFTLRFEKTFNGVFERLLNHITAK